MAAVQKCMPELQRAAAAVKNARALFVTAGAGMGVDSGLPDFRGPEGFWRAYPLLKDRHLRLENMSTPSWFHNDPIFAWGFFGHRYNLYKRTEPHRGFHILREWGEKMDYKYFVFTSNVDGHFQKAGFEEDCVMECHGSINFLQTCEHGSEIWPVPEDINLQVDEEKLQLTSDLPMGPPGYEYLARPNILMFGDWGWVNDRTDEQQKRFFAFQMSMMKEGGIPFVVIEIGAGRYVPTVRYQSESLVGNNKGTLIRINPMEPQVPKGQISLKLKGLEALEAINELIGSKESK